MNDSLPAGFALARRHNHSRIRHRNTDTGHDFGKSIVVDAVVKHVRINIVRSADSRNRNSMRPYAVNRFQMLGVHQQTGKFVTITFQTEQNAQSNVVNSAFHRPVHRFGMIVIIMLRPGRMQFLVTLFMIGFLKQDISADSGFFKLAVIFNRRRRNIDVYAADCTVFVLNTVNRPDTFQNIFYRIIDRILAGLNRQTFVPHVLKRNHFPRHFFLRQLAARNMFVLGMIRTINAAVDAVIGQIQRRKHHNPVAVIIFFYLLRQFKNFPVLFGNVTVKQNHRLAMVQPFAFSGLVQHLVNKLRVVPVGVGIGQRVQHFLMADKLFRL